jgi:hypothetical protein
MEREDRTGGAGYASLARPGESVADAVLLG